MPTTDPATRPAPIAPGRPSPARTPSPPARRRGGGDRGQATAEYALVLLGAAAVALLLLAWATRTEAIGDLLDVVVEQIVGRVA